MKYLGFSCCLHLETRRRHVQSHLGCPVLATLTRLFVLKAKQPVGKLQHLTEHVRLNSAILSWRECFCCFSLHVKEFLTCPWSWPYFHCDQIQSFIFPHQKLQFSLRCQFLFVQMFKNLSHYHQGLTPWLSTEAMPYLLSRHLLHCGSAFLLQNSSIQAPAVMQKQVY